jgi:hyperosmotically inducible protein
MRYVRAWAAALGLTMAAIETLPATTQPAVDRTIENIREELMQLPYYGVFDFLAFRYEKGTVTLQGYAYSLGTKAAAERAVRRVRGVDDVVNTIEDLPPSSIDDDIRWRTYYAIYRDPFLSRYAPGGAMLWGHRHPYRGPFGRFGAPGLAGFEMAGNYPIRIIVRGGRVTLLGIVDNESDKTVAGVRAREVTGTLGVQNDLMVENAPTRGAGLGAGDGDATRDAAPPAARPAL